MLSVSAQRVELGEERRQLGVGGLLAEEVRARAAVELVVEVLRAELLEIAVRATDARRRRRARSARAGAPASSSRGEMTPRRARAAARRRERRPASPAAGRAGRSASRRASRCSGESGSELRNALDRTRTRRACRSRALVQQPHAMHGVARRRVRAAASNAAGSSAGSVPFGSVTTCTSKPCATASSMPLQRRLLCRRRRSRSRGRAASSAGSAPGAGAR